MRALRRGLLVLASAAALVVALLPLNAGAGVVVDATAPVVSAVLVTPNPVNMPGHVHLTATVDDTLTGASVIASAQYKVDSGTWLPMTAVDGTFDAVIEDVSIVFPAPGVGTHTLAVRGEDVALNTSLPVTTPLKVLARPSLSVADVTVTEGDGVLVPMAFKVTSSAASTEGFSVDYAVEGGTATSGVDFEAVANGTLTWAPGDDTAQSVVVKVIGDLRDEYTESLSITLSSPVNATLARATADGTILDNDPLPSLSIADTSIREPSEGSVRVYFRVTVAVTSSKPITVRYATADGSARAGRDYVAKGGILTIEAGRHSKTISVKILGDDVREPNKAFYMHLFTPVTNAVIGDGLAVCIIRNFG